MAFLSLLLSALLQQPAAETTASSPTGLEWMILATLIVPAVLLILIVYVGERRTV